MRNCKKHRIEAEKENKLVCSNDGETTEEKVKQNGLLLNAARKCMASLFVCLFVCWSFH